MMLHIPEVLSQEQLAQCQALLQQAEWENGLATAGVQAAGSKDNRQIPEHSPVLAQLRSIIVQALTHHPQFFSADRKSVV